jgi:amino acid permease
MKKIILIVCFLILAGCVKSGEFGEKRERMHNMNKDQDICEKYPERCISGITW